MKIIYHRNLPVSNFAWNKDDTKLLTNKFAVINRVEKYYVITFAINGTRFEIYSKDCDKELID